MPPKLLRLAGLAAAALCAGPACAHSQFNAVGPFWSGVMHFFVSPLAVAATLGLVVALAASRDEAMLWAVSLAALAAVFGARYGPEISPLVGTGTAVFCGLLAASGREPKRMLALALAPVAGVGVGSSVGLDVAAWPGAIGAAFAAGYLALLGISVLRLALTRPRLAAILLLGRRVLGAWVAAMGLLLGTLAVRTMA